MSKYLALLLPPLTESEYTVKNSMSFVQKFKCDKITSNCKIISFDAKSQFANVPLDQTMSVILNEFIITEKLTQI